MHGLTSLPSPTLLLGFVPEQQVTEGQWGTSGGQGAPVPTPPPGRLSTLPLLVPGMDMLSSLPQIELQGCLSLYTSKQIMI